MLAMSLCDSSGPNTFPGITSHHRAKFRAISHEREVATAIAFIDHLRC
jgi:hypothetical protein